MAKVVCSPASLHRHGTRLQLRYGFGDILGARVGAHDLPGAVEDCEAEVVLAQVDPENSDFHGSIPGDARDSETVAADQPAPRS
jgi:hypothetical protein